MKVFYSAFIVLFFISYSVQAQQRFGNEWINFNQEYYKIKINQEGIYRINFNTLTKAGINVSTINPKTLQLFNLGKEQFIYVAGEADNSIDSGDYIEFYANKNDGTTDIPLYRTPQEQPHTFRSLYTDTSAYFLTWNTTANGLRITLFNDTTYSIHIAETYFIHTVNTIFPEAYYEGNIVQTYGILSEYTEGEGWLGNFFKRGGTQTRTIATPFAFTTGPVPTATVLWFGETDIDPPTGYTVNHRMLVKVGASLRLLTDTMYRGYAGVRRNYNLLNSDIGATTNFQFSNINTPLSLGADNQCVGGIFLTYARQFNLGNLSKFGFNFKGLQAGSSSYINFAGYLSTKKFPFVYDLTNHIRIGTTLAGTNVKFIVPNAGTDKQLYINDTTDIVFIQQLEKIQFTPINFNTGNYDYLIVTNEQLLSGANNYATYRSSTGYKPLVVTTKQLYDQFYYGLHHPLAIRNFCDFALEQSASAPKYLLLLGKGQLHWLVRTDTVGYYYDFVPTIGSPASDYMFTSGLKGTTYEPAIPTGRIPAMTNADIQAYLDKLNDYENTPAQMWQKNILHLAGGRDQNENTTFTNSLNGYKKIIEDTFVGGKTKLYTKDQAVPVSTGLKTYIQKDLENGLGMMTYLGHGAADILEIDFGEPKEINNKGKYPVMMFSGCLLGNSFTKGSLGEKFILYPNGGALAWISNSGYAFSPELEAFTGVYYNNVGVKSYGKGIADILKQTIADYQDKSGKDYVNLFNCRQYAYEGDPALKFYFKAQPDYTISNIFTSPREVTALADSFTVGVVVANAGKALDAAINISMKRTLPDNSVVVLPSKRISGLYYSDTVFFTFISKDLKTKGLNYFEANIDDSNEVAEINENNNRFKLPYFITAEGAQILSPMNYEIVGNPIISLKAQPSTIDGAIHDFFFELDTNANFNSPFIIRSPVVSGNFFAEWRPQFIPSDSNVYYWRVRLANQAGLEAWQASSFIYIKNSEGGWAQKHFQQFDNIQSNSIVQDTTKRTFSFVRKLSWFHSINTYGQNGGLRTQNENYWPTRSVVISNGISILAYNPDNEARLSDSSQFNPLALNYPPGGNNGIQVSMRSGTYYYDTYKDTVGHVNPNYKAIRDSLRNHIKEIPSRYHIFIHNGAKTGVEEWDTSLINAFKSIGATKITYLKEGWPYLLMTKKDPLPGDPIYEMLPDTTPGSIAGQILNQNLTKTVQLYPLATSGDMSSEWISGASKWKKAFVWNSARDNKKDIVSYDIVGMTPDAREVILDSAITADSIDISSIKPALFPKLKIVTHYADDSLRTTAQLKHWMITFDGLPEASVNTNFNNLVLKDTLQEGDSIKVNLAFQNISKYDMDSILVLVKLLDASSKEDTLMVRKLKALPANDMINFSAAFSSLGRKGLNRLQVIFNPGILPEYYYTNNVYQRNFFVIGDNTKPMLDVTFDGIHINNNEIIKPTPLILITASDDNKFLLLSDTQYFKMFLKTPEGITQRINFSSPQITFTPAISGKNKASIEFKPEYLSDGIYTLTANVTDASGNKAGMNDYSINFEVISKATVTNFYPYPNPVNNAMRFVFTLTGQNIPDDIKVQISTITGKVVKTITRDELGSIHIGTNITDVVWNGTDEYGDRLANGVYLYKVFINDKKNTYTLRASDGDASFKNNDTEFNKNLGKIYLLR